MGFGMRRLSWWPSVTDFAPVSLWASNGTSLILPARLSDYGGSREVIHQPTISPIPSCGPCDGFSGRTLQARMSSYPSVVARLPHHGFARCLPDLGNEL